MIDVLFRADDGPGIGAGHVMRCLALAEAVREGGGRAHLSAVRGSPLHGAWAAVGAEVWVDERPAGGDADRDRTLDLARRLGTAWLVADSYAFEVPWLDRVAASASLLYLDDLGRRDAAAAIVLNQNAGAEQRYGQTYRRCRRALLGLPWFLLGSRWRNALAAPQGKRLLVSLGGDDPTGCTGAVMAALLADGRDFVADVVCGGPPERLAEARKLAADHPERFVVHRGPVNLAELAVNAAVAICGGGVTSVELISLGIPAVVVILSEDQAGGAKSLAAAGAVVSLEGNELARAAPEALNLLAAEPFRRPMAQAGRRLVDGGGARRVVAAMEAGA